MTIEDMIGNKRSMKKDNIFVTLLKNPLIHMNLAQ